MTCWCLMLNTFIFNFVGLLPDCATIPLLETLVEIRDKRGFRLSCIGLFVTFRMLRCLLGPRVGIITLPLLLLICVHFGAGKVISRVVGFLICIAYINAFQLLPTIYWVMAYGASIDEVTSNVLDYPAYFIYILVVASMAYASKFLLRHLRSFVETRSISMIDYPVIALLFMQIFWVVPLHLDSWTTRITDPLIITLITVCHTLSFIAAVMLLDDANEAVAAQKDEIRTKALTKAAEGYERHCRELDAHIVRAAELRHDFRNLMQLVAGLVRSGQRDEARSLIEEGLSAETGPLEADVMGRHEGSASGPDALEAPIRTPWMRARFILYLANGIICACMLAILLSDASVSREAKALSIVVVLLWLAFIPLLVSITRWAQRADIARVRSAAAQEMLDARVFYSERIMGELAQAERVEEDLRQRLESARRKLEQEPAGSVSQNELFGIGDGAVQPVHRRYCENTTLDTFIFLKASACEEQGIRFTCAASVPEEIGLSNLELCSLFSNVLDNAMTACASLAEGERWVDMKADVRAGQMVVVVKNSCDGGAPLAGKGAQGERRGMDAEHGWGMKILSELARRHGGSASFSEERGVFTTVLAVGVGG